MAKREPTAVEKLKALHGEIVRMKQDVAERQAVLEARQSEARSLFRQLSKDLGLDDDDSSGGLGIGIGQRMKKEEKAEYVKKLLDVLKDNSLSKKEACEAINLDPRSWNTIVQACKTSIKMVGTTAGARYYLA